MKTIKHKTSLQNNEHQVHITKTASSFTEYSHTVKVLHDQRNRMGTLMKSKAVLSNDLKITSFQMEIAL